MRLTSALTLLLLPITLLACGDSGGDETGTTPATTNPVTTEAASSGGLTEPTGSTGQGSTGLTTGASSTGEPVTTGSSSTTDPSAATSTGPGDTSTGDSTGPITASESGSSDDTGPTPGGVCETDKDCALHNDCCDCYAIPADQEDPICKKGCDNKTCDLLGIDQAVCRFGVCTTERVACDPSMVLCDSLPPDCPKGQVAGVAGGCWSGLCVPALSCDVVPDCGVCPEGSMCVQKVSKQKMLPTCEPIPGECNGEVDCDCAGSFVCTGDFNACNDLGDDLSCGCPVC